MKIKSALLPVLFTPLLMTACTSYDPVPVSQCPTLVKHTNSILKKLAKPPAELMAECKQLTDEQRGCIKAAKIVHDLVQCKS